MLRTWSQCGYNGGYTGYNPNAEGVPSGIDQQLLFEPPSGYNETVDIRTVLAGSDEYVVAGRNLATGRAIVAGFNRNDGELTWHRYFVSVTAGPVLAGGWVVVGSHDRLHGVERAADRAEWVKPVAWQSYGDISHLAIQNESVYVGGHGGSENEEGSVAVIDPSSGEIQHNHRMEGVTTLFVTNDHVFAGWDAFFSAGLRVFNRTLKSEYSLDDAAYDPSQDDDLGWTPRVVANGHVYGLTSKAEELVAYDLNDRAEIWRRSIKYGPLTRPVVIKDILYYWDDMGLTALNSYTGDVLWQCTEARRAETDYGSNVDESMVAAITSLVVGGDRPMAVDPDSGDILWTHDDPFTVHAVVDNELIASRGSDVLVFRDTGSSETKIYDTGACSTCGANLDRYSNPSFCPECGVSFDD